MMKTKVMQSVIITARHASCEGNSSAVPISPLKASIRPNNTNRVCLSHLYWGAEINLIRGLLNGIISAVPFSIFSKLPNQYIRSRRLYERPFFLYKPVNWLFPIPGYTWKGLLNRVRCVGRKSAGIGIIIPATAIE